MLNVQIYLLNNSLELLQSEFGIQTKWNDDKSLVILDYDQIESAKVKDHPIVRECRGLVLDSNFKIVQKAFNRFFNLYENNDTDLFDWSNFGAKEKVDGSLIKISYYNDDLLVTTRASFANSECGFSGNSWRELVVSCLNDIQLAYIKTMKSYTFVFEFCSPWNQVVCFHEHPKLVLLGVFDNLNGNEIDSSSIIFFETPKIYNFSSLNDIERHMEELESSKSTTEGVVVTDINGVKLKIKSKYYISLHKVAGNGNICNPKHLAPIVFDGDEEEILSYWKNLRPLAEEIRSNIKLEFDELYSVWKSAKEIDNQKDFAIYIIQERKCRFSSILFNLKKSGNIKDEKSFLDAWKSSKELFVKFIYG